MSVWLVAECRHTRSHLHPPPINPSATEPYYTKSVWHVEECKHTHARYSTPQLTLVVQSPTIPSQFDMWKHTDIPRSDLSPCSLHLVLQSPTTPLYRALLHHVSLTCGRVQTYPGQICIPYQSTLVLQSPTTLCQFDMWKHADIPRSDVSPLLIASSATEPYYTMSVWDVEECRDTQVRSTPYTNWTQYYKALLHHVSLTCGRMQMYPGQMYTTPLIEPSATEFCYTMPVWYVAEYRWTQIRPFCHNTHVNWLKCFHVTTLNNWWSHIEWYVEDSSEIIWWIIFISMNREDLYPSLALNTWCRWWTVV